jgi:hypothetical protein
MWRELLVIPGIEDIFYLKEPNSSLRDFTAVKAVLFITSTGPPKTKETPY